MNSDRSLVDFGALLVEKYFKKHEKQDEVDLNEYLDTMEQLVPSGTCQHRSLLFSANRLCSYCLLASHQQ